MTSANIEAKAARLLATGAVTVIDLQGDDVTAEVRGDSGMTWVVAHAHGRWRCDCPAHLFRGICSHITAVELVATRTVARAQERDRHAA